MGGESKILAKAGGLPVIVHTLRALEESGHISEIIVASREEDIPALTELCGNLGFTKLRGIVRGGRTRAESVMLALSAADPSARIAAVHDGARPCVTARVIRHAVDMALEKGASCPAVPLRDTLKTTEDGLTVSATPERRRYMLAQTPQCFDMPLLKAALAAALKDGESPTDCSSAVERLGVTVYLTPGDEGNIKITTPADLAWFRALVEAG
jgi:2-C-methyl-D-erythritol 4-phosphate cytidylyltransferase